MVMRVLEWREEEEDWDEEEEDLDEESDEDWSAEDY